MKVCESTKSERYLLSRTYFGLPRSHYKYGEYAYYIACASYFLLPRLYNLHSTSDRPVPIRCQYSRAPSLSDLRSPHKMAQEYASNKPQGFKNHIENVAIVGVSLLLTLALKTKFFAKIQNRQVAKSANTSSRN